jgi:hypothetical protein
MSDADKIKSLFTCNEVVINADTVSYDPILNHPSIKCLLVCESIYDDEAEMLPVNPMQDDQDLMCFTQQDLLFSKESVLEQLPKVDHDYYVKSVVKESWGTTIFYSLVSEPSNWIGFAVINPRLSMNNSIDKNQLLVNAELSLVYVKPDFRHRGFGQVISLHIGVLLGGLVENNINILDEIKSVAVDCSGQSSEHYGQNFLQCFFFGVEHSLGCTLLPLEFNFTDDI